ncbi:MAG: HAMP domain-containing histidine kinase [Firmicutes bacterium]|nr:HAMP domain-containing histidine kinase [Bacillota bacterium]
MKSITMRNFLLTAGTVILSFVILGAAFMFLGRRYVVSDKQDSLSRTAGEVSHSLWAELHNMPGSDLADISYNPFIAAVSSITGYHVFLCDASGAVINSSDDLLSPFLGRRIAENYMATLRDTGALSAFGTLGGFYPVPYYVVAQAIHSPFGTGVAGYVFIASDSGSIMRAWGTFLGIVLVAALVVLAVALLLSYFTSKRQAKPLNEMAAAARHFERGDFSARVGDVRREDEIGELTRSFNAMAESLEKSEELRREFIANISHELKTPMTSISGFADGLLDGTIPEESRDKYLRTISSETKRLSRLVRSMLDLSVMQRQGASAMHMSEFDLSEVLRRTLVNFEAKATRKNLDVDVDLPEERMMVPGDADAITRVVYNLLDNAIKFSRENSTIGLSLWKQDGRAYVSVKDQGETIPESELPLIFDRFHKADRSRSQDRDGVGLGLNLVKTILSNHDGDISVTSRDGVTEFIFALNLTLGGVGRSPTKEK